MHYVTATTTLAAAALASAAVMASVCSSPACRRTLRTALRARPAAAAAPPRPVVVLIAGPTGVGKSAVALRLATQLRGEIVSVDSVQVYRELDVGSNKASPAEQLAVRHHLLDVADPREPFSAGDFYARARDAVAEICARGALPICVGGTSMYMRWLASGPPTAPRADPALAAAVGAELKPLEAAADWDAGLALLAPLDAERAASLSRNDWYRLARSITIARQTNAPLSALKPTRAPHELVHGACALRCFFLHADRTELSRRIDERCERMLLGGLLRETYELLRARKLRPDSPAGRAVGYRQAIEYLLRAEHAAGDAAAWWRFVHAFAQASRTYAAAQMKWFRKEPAFEWVEAGHDADATAAHIARVCALSHEQDDERRSSAPFRAEQESARARNVQQGKDMKVYVPAFALLGREGVADELVAEADRYALELQGTLGMRLAPPAEHEREELQ